MKRNRNVKINLGIVNFLRMAIFAVAAQFNFTVEARSTEIDDLSLKDILDIKVSVLTKKAISNRETPGITSVITREEILNSGARDLLDALSFFIPGATFESDVEGAVGLNMRGIWAQEGKLLLMLDGQEMNERIFGTSQFGNHINLDNVDRIEVVRGPGSAIYGGYAEVGVINVITRGPEQNQAFAKVTNAQMSQNFRQRGGTFGFGKEFGDFESSLSFTLMPGNQSQVPYVDGTNTPVSTVNGSELNLLNANILLKYKGLSFRSVSNRYHTTQVEEDGTSGGPYHENYDTYVQELKYDYEVNDSFRVIPKLSYKWDTAWQVLICDDANPMEVCYSNYSAVKKSGDLSTVWEPTDNLTLVSGFEAVQSDINTDSQRKFNNMADGYTQTYFNYGLYSQSTWNTKFLNVTLGARYDWTNRFGSAFVPRLGLTKVIDKFHVKGILSQSFRVPLGVLPDRAPPGITLSAEKANNYELETGYQLTNNMFLVANFYDVVINDPIVYYIPPGQDHGGYQNYGKLETRGVEAQYKLKEKLYEMNVNYSFYSLVSTNISMYTTTSNASTTIGAPAHKLNVLFTYKPMSKLYITPSLQYFSRRDYVDPSNSPQSVEPKTYFNLNARMDDLFMPGLSASVGVMDLFNHGIVFPPGYNSGMNVLPGPSRSFTTTVSYSVPL